MDVHLLVYDLSRGLAKDMSMSILGFQLDAVYHTSIELRGREFVYDGGILEIQPGSSHLGRPMERLFLGVTMLSMDIVRDYLTSVKVIYTAEKYDLFTHNCNNFTDSFANFLIGKGIPDYITNMPQSVMESPLGRMLLPQLTAGMNASRNGLIGLGQTANAAAAEPAILNRVHGVVRLQDYMQLLSNAEKGSCVVFFTSSSCPPCKTLYPLYDELAEQYGNRTAFLKVDVTLGREIAAKYEIRATPTFITMVQGEIIKRWSGADPGELRGNVRLLGHMGMTTHPHDRLHLPNLCDPAPKPVLYSKTPPLEKLYIKMDRFGLKPDMQALTGYVEIRAKNPAANTQIPGLLTLGQCVRGALDELKPDVVFTVVDLFRSALTDPRISAYYAQERDMDTILALVDYVNQKGKQGCPYSMRLVTLQAACNMFSTPLFADVVLGDTKLRQAFTKLISSSFLDDSHSQTRVATSSLLFNFCLTQRQRRRKQHDKTTEPKLPEEDEVELAAALVEAITQETESAEALHGMLLSLGNLVYGVDLKGDLADLLRALDAKDVVLEKKKLFPDEKLVKEVGEELLGKGLRKP